MTKARNHTDIIDSVTLGKETSNYWGNKRTIT